MRKVISVVIIVSLLFTASALTKNIWDSYKKVQSLEEIRKKEQSLRKETKDLKKELEDRKSSDFVEREARNKLGLSRPGESIYVVEQETADEAPVEENENTNLSNWQLWLKVFTDQD